MIGLLFSTLCLSPLYGAGSSLSIYNTSVVEGDTGTTDMIFTIMHTIVVSYPITINYTTSDITAKAGKDYKASSGSIILPPDQRKITLTVPIINDTKISKIPKIFKVTISSDTTIANTFATGTIVENDIAPLKASEFKGERHEMAK